MILTRPGERGDDANRPILIGLTGPIGCGKSTVARMLADVGGVVIDADELAREATAMGSTALPEIRARFGDAVFREDGALDRAALASIVFSDAAALADLEAIVHPRVRASLENALEDAARGGAPFVSVEAIKLVEGGLADRCDEVWLVDCSAEIQHERLTDRGSAAEDAQRRLAAQGPNLVERLSAQIGGRVPLRRLRTDGSIEETREAVEEALAEVLDRRIG